MANKLFGTADSTLVAAAFKHGASNIPMNLSSVYKQREKNVEDFATGINEMFDKIYADDKATNDLLTDVSAKSLNLMESGGTVNEYALTEHNNIINNYKEKLKSITSEYGMGKGGDLERSKLRSEMNSYLANMEKSGVILTELKKNSANNVLLSDVGDQKKELLTLIIQDENNGTSVTKPEYIKGDIYYTLPGTDVKMTMQELAEGFSVKNPALLSNINKKLTDFLARGKASGKAMTEEDALRFTNQIKASMSSMDEIRNVAQERFGNMKYSFEEVLTGRGKDVNGNIDTSVLEIVYNELEKLGGADLDNDGDIDSDDKRLLVQARKNGTYISNENGYTLVDAIKKDKQLYRDVMANYITETAARDFYGQGVGQFKSKSPSNIEESTGFLTTKKRVPFGGYSSDKGYPMLVDHSIAKHIYDQFNLAMDGKEAEINAFGERWNYDTNSKNWTQASDSRNMGSTDDFRAKGFQIQDPDFIALTSGAEQVITAENQKELKLNLKSEEDNLLATQTLLRDIFMKKEELGEGDLQKMFKSGYTVKEQGGDMFGFDSVAIYDKQDNFVGSYGMDFKNAKRARNTAEAFYKKFGPEGLNVLNIDSTTSDLDKYYKLAGLTKD